MKRYVKASNHWREKTECKTKNGKIVRMQNVSSIYNDQDYYVLYDADGNFVEKSLDFNDLHDKLYGIYASTSVKASSDIAYPWVTVEFHGEIKAYGNLKDASLVMNIMEAMRRDDAFAKAMSDFYNPEYTTMEWDYSIYEEIALGIVDFCKDQYREWKSLTNRGREDNPFVIISEDESIVIS